MRYETLQRKMDLCYKHYKIHGNFYRYKQEHILLELRRIVKREYFRDDVKAYNASSDKPDFSDISSTMEYISDRWYNGTRIMWLIELLEVNNA